IAAAHDANIAGLKYNYTAAGHMGAVPGQQRGRAVTPMSQVDMDQVYKKIDPNNKMPEGVRNTAAMSAVWQYFMKKGNLQGAQQAAGMMLQHYKLNAQRFAAIAAVAANNGNIDAAAKAALKAYANIPDGNNLHLSKADNGQLQYSYTDEKGNQISGGIV